MYERRCETCWKKKWNQDGNFGFYLRKWKWKKPWKWFWSREQSLRAPCWDTISERFIIHVEGVVKNKVKGFWLETDLETISTERIEWNYLQKCDVRREKRAQDHDLELEQEKRVWRREQKIQQRDRRAGLQGFQTGRRWGSGPQADCCGKRTAQGVARGMGRRSGWWLMGTELRWDSGMLTRNWRQQG